MHEPFGNISGEIFRMCYGEAEVIERLVQEVTKFREMFTELEQQRNKISPIVNEYFTDNASTTIYVKPRTHNLELISTVYVYIQFVGASGFGTLTLGDLSIPVPQGWSTFENMKLLLTETSKRQLASGGASGTMTLILMGEDLADKGRF
jgi:hypothetical protein